MVVVLNRGAREVWKQATCWPCIAICQGQPPCDQSEREIKLPAERYGVVFVFRVFEKVSYALVMHTTRLGQRARRSANALAWRRRRMPPDQELLAGSSSASVAELTPLFPQAARRIRRPGSRMRANRSRSAASSAKRSRGCHPARADNNLRRPSAALARRQVTASSVSRCCLSAALLEITKPATASCM